MIIETLIGFGCILYLVILVIGFVCFDTINPTRLTKILAWHSCIIIWIVFIIFILTFSYGIGHMILNGGSK